VVEVVRVVAEAVVRFEAALEPAPGRLEVIAFLGRAHWLAAVHALESGGAPSGQPVRSSV
jgi:hypothetical protein